MKVTVISWNYPHKTRHFAYGEIQALKERGDLYRLITSKYRVYNGKMELIKDHRLLFRIVLKGWKLVGRHLFPKVTEKHFRELFFDWYVKRLIGSPDLLYLDKYSFFRCIQQAKKRQIPVASFQPMCHNSYTRQLLEADQRDFGLSSEVFNEEIYRHRLRGLAAVDFIVGHSKIVLESDRQVGMDVSNAGLAYGCVDSEIYYPKPEVKSKTFTGIFVGHEWMKKGLVHLLRAWESIPDVEGRLLIVGKIPEVVRSRYGSDSRVDFVGFQSEKRVREMYQEATFLVLPAVIDAGPKAVLEAMASGLPVIVTENMGYSEIMTDGVEGYIVPPQNPEAIAAAIRKLYDDRSRCHEMGFRARATAEKWNHSAHGEQVASLLQEYLQGRRTS